MKLRPVWIIALLVVGAAFAIGAETQYTKQNWDKTIKEVSPDTGLIALYRDWLMNTTDIELARKVQGEWYGLDSAGAVDFFQTQHQKDPSSTKWAYLYGRYATTAEKLSLGRDIINLDPKWPYGYRLLVATYQPLLDHSASPADKAVLEPGLLADEKYFSGWQALQPQDDFANASLFSLKIYRGQTDEARAMFEQAKKDSLGWADDEKELVLLAAQSQYDQVKRRADQLSDHNPANARSAYLDALRQAGSYDQLKTETENQPAGTRVIDEWYDFAAYASRSGKTDDAFAALNKSIDAGFTWTGYLKWDPDLANLHDLPSWDDVVARATASKAKNAEKARAEVLKSKIDKPAPDWTLTDAKGNTVKLADLKGQVVMLDFFAVWCNPCRMAMPVINDYMNTSLPAQGVNVFSIQVWEQPPQKAKLFFQKKNYAMHLLFGNDDLVKAYGINGIPYLCVIDKNGHIRYEERGYTPDLSSALPIWIEDLTRTQ